MAMAAALLILLLAAPAAFAATHTVGGNSGWALGVNYGTWASGETFNVGDTLVFNYDSTHAVDVVNEAAYTGCSTSNPLKSYTTGPTTVNLTTAGSMYFICPTSGHCAGGMKLQVNVAAASTTPPSTPSSNSPPPPTTTTTTSPPPPPPRSGAAGIVCNMSQLMVGLSLVLATLFASMS